MTWVCPFCEREYPDSSVGLPAHEEADSMTFCMVCAVHPEELRELVDQWRVTANYLHGPDGNVSKAEVYEACANALEELIE